MATGYHKWATIGLMIAMKKASKGMLHEALGVDPDKKITLSELMKAKKSKRPKMAKSMGKDSDSDYA